MSTRRALPSPARARRGWRFWWQVLLANALVLGGAACAAEIVVRYYREGGLGPALRSFVGGPAAPRQLATGDWLRPDDVLGYTLNPAHAEISSLGIRGPELAPKLTGRLRILHLGDSVSFAEHGFVEQLREDLLASGREVEIVNASVPGYTTHQERLLLERIADAVAPDVLTVQYCLNDNHRFLHRLSDDGWLLTREAREALLPEGDDLFSLLTRHSYLVLEVRRALLAFAERPAGVFPWVQQSAFSTAWRDESWPSLDAELGAIEACATALGARLLILAVPYEPQLTVAALTTDRAYALRPQARLAEICRARGIPLLDLVPEFLAQPVPRLFDDGIHLSEAGHRLVAKSLRTALERSGML